MTNPEAQIQIQAALLRSRGESPGRCELCGYIILYGERYGTCPDTEVLTCKHCLSRMQENVQ